MTEQILQNDALSRTKELRRNNASNQWVRIVTAASLFDGHDAAINIMRRILQAQGAEVIHLGHDRSVEEIVAAAIQEDAHAVAVSSYQGGHIEFFKYLVDQLKQQAGDHIRVYGGGGGTILPSEIAELQAYGVAHIFSPEEGRRLGLDGMIRMILDECQRAHIKALPDSFESLSPLEPARIARLITTMESLQECDDAWLETLRMGLDNMAAASPSQVIGLTGPGGAGKSSVLDELIRRFRVNYPGATTGTLLIDPTRRSSQGALLGDRIRLNAIHGTGMYTRSLATRRAHASLPAAVRDAIQIFRAAKFDYIFVETAGIGQSDSQIVDLVDVPIYVMTPEYGAPSQLEKIDMLELAELVILNKADRRGSKDAIRDICKQWKRNRNALQLSDENVPVVDTIASQWDDPGIDRAYTWLLHLLADNGEKPVSYRESASVKDRAVQSLIAPARLGYLNEIASTVRSYHDQTKRLAERVAVADAITRTLANIGKEMSSDTQQALHEQHENWLSDLTPELKRELDEWPETVSRYEADQQSYSVRDHTIAISNHGKTLSNLKIPKVALPKTRDWGELARCHDARSGCYPCRTRTVAARRAADRTRVRRRGPSVPRFARS